MITTRVAVVADSPVVRAGLRALLAAEPGLVVVAAHDATDAPGDEGSPIVLAAAVDADVVVWASTATRLPPPPTDEADDLTHAPALVILAERVDAGLARRAVAAGARALLALDAGEAAIVAAVHAAAAGLLTLPRELAAALLEAMPVETATALLPGAPRADALTPREREVLALLAQGLANKQIAPRLGITEHTVKAHVAAIYEKLGAGNRAEAAVAAARLGLLLL